MQPVAARSARPARGERAGTASGGACAPARSSRRSGVEHEETRPCAGCAAAGRAKRAGAPTRRTAQSEATAVVWRRLRRDRQPAGRSRVPARLTKAVPAHPPVAQRRADVRGMAASMAATVVRDFSAQAASGGMVASGRSDALHPQPSAAAGEAACPPSRGGASRRRDRRAWAAGATCAAGRSNHVAAFARVQTGGRCALRLREKINKHQPGYFGFPFSSACPVTETTSTILAKNKLISFSLPDLNTP